MKYDLKAMSFVKEYAEEALTRPDTVVRAFIWDQTPQGNAFWADYLRGKRQHEGQRFIRAMLEQEAGR